MAIVWLDLRVNDLQRAQEFYRNLLGWTFEPFEDAAVLMFEGGEQVGMMSQASGDVSKAAPVGAVPYFEVKDMTAALQVAASMGATVEYGPEEDEDGVRFVDLVDPQGLRIGLVDLTPRPLADF